MDKNKLIALLIAVAVFLGPFRYAYVEIDITTPLFTLVMFLLTVAGTITAMLIGMKTSK